MTGQIRDHRNYVLTELRSSEVEYVERLRGLVENYLNYIQLDPSVPAELKADILSIFSNLDEIYTFHKEKFLPAISACKEDDILSIMQCFLAHKNKFSVYIRYCKSKPTSDAARTEHETFFRERQLALGQKLSIEDLLITPVQRFTKYQLLLQDLLKDTKKLRENTSSIEEALKLMKSIPRETNNIICMSMIRGVPPSKLVGHGSLWLQDTLLFWSDRTHGGVKAESRHIFLFDHRILVTQPANSDGFFDYQLDIKTLQGTVVEEMKVDPLRFSFTTADNCSFMFQALSVVGKKEWLSAINSILASQNQMMRALVFGKPAIPKVSQGQKSESVVWEDSDSSVDSSPRSSTGDPDWPTSEGYKKLKPQEESTNSLTLSRPPSSGSSSSSRKSRSLSWAATLSPKVIARFKRRPTLVSQQGDHISMPILPSQRRGGLRSPGCAPQEFEVFVRPGSLWLVRDIASERRECVFAGQLATVLDNSRDGGGGGEWAVKLLTGVQAGSDVQLSRHYLEPYNAPITRQVMSSIYSLGKELGRGRFSKVFKAKHRGTGTRYAVKVLQQEVREEIFEHELCVVFHLNHPSIARCLGGVVNHRERILTFELVKGRNILDHLVHKSKVTDAEVAELMRQILAALAYLHSRSVCHLDCRPCNILVQDSQGGGAVKLVDFGAARHFGCSQQMLPLEKVYETPSSYYYMSPEVFQQQPLAGPADIWTIGVVTFVIFHGKYPFSGESEAATVAKVLRSELVLPNEGSCSQNVRSFIKGALLLDPLQRFSAATAAIQYKWLQEDHSLPGGGPWQVNTTLIKHFLSHHS